MRSSVLVLASLAAVAVARPQGVTDVIAPSGTAPQGCQPSYAGKFNLSPVKVVPAKRSIEERQLAGDLTLTLDNGILKDQAGRTGYIADNYQFQFDAPPQTGALTTAGYSVCGNSSLALGPTTVFYQCDSGNLVNLYDRKWAPQCEPIHLQVVPLSGSGPSPVTQIPDGQPQAPSAPVITQISDGQPQAPPAPIITQISDGQPQAPPPAVITQISDGQPQAPPAPVITQISDGQPQAPPAPVITQISDGQPQVPSAPVLTQITDGQVQVPTYTPPPFTGAAPVATPVAALAAIMGVVALL